MKINQENIKVYPDGRVDAANASLYLGLAPKTLAMMRSNGKSPPFIKRGRIFYFLKDLDEWLALGGKKTSTAQHRAQRHESV